VIGVARAAAIVLVAVLAAIFPTIRVTLRIAILAAIFTARGFIGLASDGRCGEQGARDEQCSTQL
jgi:hypothetical protein